MAVDKFGIPIFDSNPLTKLTALSPPTATSSLSTSLTDLVDSIKAPTLAKPAQSTNTLTLLLGALNSRAQAAGVDSGSAAMGIVGNIPATGKARKAVEAALSQTGIPYQWGGTAWGKALDCSGLTQQALAKAGIAIPRTTYDQWKMGKKVSSPKNLRAGDLVFFHKGPRGPEHVGMYIGNDQFVQAPHTGDVVKVSKLSTYGRYMGARRYS
jgi:cell wall-associated NlpC family hydrolase